jgi:uncharacterized SAM-binding protein YcdF (DUF218 family)
VFDFAAFARRVGETPLPPEAQADGIVVLTGAPGRIAAALDRLDAGAGQRLLISGVHPDIGAGSLQATHGGAPELWACCVDLGHQATSTLGNAGEVADWTRAQGYDSLLIVTSNFHMPRAMLEISRVLPDTALYPLPVSSGVDPLAVWSDPRAFRQIFLEWAKYRMTSLFGPIAFELPEGKG